VRTDNPKLLSLFRADFAINSGKDFRIGSFHSLCSETGNISDWFGWIFKQATNNVGGSLAEHIGKDIIQLDVGNGQTVLRTVLFTDLEVGEFPAVAHQITKLPNICRRDKAAGNKVVLEDIRNPFGILLVGFLALDGFDILRVSKNDIAGVFQNVVDRNPILACGFHTDILAVVLSKP